MGVYKLLVHLLLAMTALELLQTPCVLVPVGMPAKLLVTPLQELKVDALILLIIHLERISVDRMKILLTADIPVQLILIKILHVPILEMYV